MLGAVLETPKSLVYEAPSSVEEFCKRDADYVFRLVRKLVDNTLPASQDAEDIAADILEKLIARDVISMYRPDHVSVHNGRNVTWRAFLSAQVSLYVRGKRAQVNRRNEREMLLCDTSVGDGTTRWVEQFGGTSWDDYPSLSRVQVLERLRNYLATVQVSWPILTVFEEMVDCVEQSRRFTRVTVQEKFAIRESEAKTWSYVLRNELKKALQSPPITERYPVGGLLLSAAEVREAANALKRARGNHVLPALTEAEHRLAAVGKTWYLKYAAEEIKLFPKLDQAPAGGGRHGDKVKKALIHRLERLLVPVPEVVEVEPEVSSKELLEFELWRIPGLTSDQVDGVLGVIARFYG